MQRPASRYVVYLDSTGWIQVHLNRHPAAPKCFVDWRRVDCTHACRQEIEERYFSIVEKIAI